MSARMIARFIVALCLIFTTVIGSSAEAEKRLIEVPGPVRINFPREMTAKQVEEALNNELAFQVDPQTFKVSLVPSGKALSPKHEAIPPPLESRVQASATPSRGSNTSITHQRVATEDWTWHFVGLLGLGLIVLMLLQSRRRSTIDTKAGLTSNTSIEPNQTVPAAPTGKNPSNPDGAAAISPRVRGVAKLRFGLLRFVRGVCGFLAAMQIVGLLPVLTWLQQPDAVTDKMATLVGVKLFWMLLLGAIFFVLRDRINQIHTKEYGVPHPALENKWAV